MPDAPPPPHPFADLDDFIAIPRLDGLVLSPDGTRLVTTVAELDAARTAYTTALWELDPTGERPARRLTTSIKGESAPAFTPEGDLLFLSARPDPAETDADEDRPAALHLLPAGGGEGRIVATRPGGFDAVLVAREGGTVVALSPPRPGSGDAADDEARRKERADRKVNAVLHDSYPVRYWDHDLGPASGRILAGDTVPSHPVPGDDPARLDLRDLTPTPGRGLDEAELDVSSDGRLVVTTWQVPDVGGRRLTLQVIDVATGDRRPLFDEPDAEAFGPAVSPDGRRVAAVVETLSTVERPPTFHLVVIDLATGGRTDLPSPGGAPPSTPTWTPDGTAVVVTADERGREPVFRIDVATGATTRLTADDAAYADVCASPDGTALYAVRSAIDSAPAVVRLAADRTDQHPTALRGPTPPPPVPGTVTEVEATAEDGTPLRAWLALPADADTTPAPLFLWVHGGPLYSWNAWSWRWNPWLMVARGYAVLLPDPALSTGYGPAFVERGWGAWGGPPYTDLMTLTDAAEARDDVDASRTACMGGSFGGYMANWIAGHTDRFDAIVTHASLWALDQFGPTTDAYHYWRRELTPEMAAANSPHLHVDAITTPMLVIHGDKDYRVPVGDALRLWAELAERHQGADGVMPHRFLLFPDENHWVLKPQHARLWYQTVLAFTAWHVLGEGWEPPELLT